MNIKEWIQQIQSGQLSEEEAEQLLQQYIETKTAGISDLGFAQLDINREKRTGFPEVIFGEGKSAEQIISIFKTLQQHASKVIATRVDREKANEIMSQIRNAQYASDARIVYSFNKPLELAEQGYVAIVCAGTSDIHVAEEAAFIAECMGSRAERIYDVGVSGIHRLFRRLDLIREAAAIVVVAGMEGALASVIGGLVSKPVIAVPTSVGYGANFQGIAPLLTMLNSCAPGVSVVNIDNGFGAGYIAGTIHQNQIK